MKWNVLYYSFHKKQIETYNIFHHSSFHHAFYEIAQTCKDKGHFAEELWHCLMYYFWGKSEYEILIYPWPCNTEHDKPKKVDIFSQITCNWEGFVDYVWEQRMKVEQSALFHDLESAEQFQGGEKDV